jgi:hypothetical protein
VSASSCVAPLTQRLARGRRRPGSSHPDRVRRQVRVALALGVAVGTLLATSSPAAAEANVARFLVEFKAGASRRPVPPWLGGFPCRTCGLGVQSVYPLSAAR